MLTKVISGCQTGVDEAALQAAFDRGIETGGYIPKGYKTLKGPRPDLAKKYKLIEHSSSSYKERTWDNVALSDGTLRFANKFTSPGERCTYNAIQNYKKPNFDIYVTGNIIHSQYDIIEHKYSTFLYEVYTVGVIDQWIKQNKIKVLNIAGNSEETYPGIYNTVYNFLLKFFEEYKNTNDLRQKGELIT